MDAEDLSYEGKVVLVTGGTKGIGRVIVQRFVRRPQRGLQPFEKPLGERRLAQLRVQRGIVEEIGHGFSVRTATGFSRPSTIPAVDGGRD